MDSTTGSPTPIRVLHVDDEPAFADIVAEFLEREADRIGVETATSVDDVLERLAEGGIDCIVSDYDMPGANGIEFLETVRTDYPRLPFILYTGKGSEEIASDAISAGVTDYLQKGVGTDRYAVLANRIMNAVDQYRTHEALEESQKRLSLFIEQSPLGVVEWDENFEFVRVNEAAEAILGYSEVELIGRSWETIVPDTEVDRVAVTVDELIEAEGGYHSLNENVRKDGERIICEWHNRVVTDEAGDVVGFFSQFQDVTERQDRERKLTLLRARIQELMYTETTRATAERAVAAADDIIDAPLSGIHLVNDDETALEPVAVAESVPRAFPEVPSFERNSEPGSRAALVWDIFDGGEPLHVGSLSTSDRLHEASPAESVIFHPLGEHGVFIISAPDADAFTETDRLLVEILADNLRAALDRVEREQVLRTRQERLERLHEATRDLIRADSQQAVVERIAGAAEDILDFSITSVRLYDPDAGGLVPVADTDQVSNVLPERDVFRPGDGSLNWAAYESDEVQIFDDIEALDFAVDQGTGMRSLMILPMGGFGTIAVGETVPGAFDDTDEFLARILATAAETALSSQEQKTRLQYRQEDLERQNERLDEFATFVSHDLRNPLEVANAGLELARAECDSDHLDDVEQAHDRMGRLIDDLLTLARTAETVAERVPLSLQGVLEECWAHVETADATLVTDIRRPIRADENRLRQMLENLIRNAVEHGGPTVTVRVGELDDGFYIEDDGPGIPEIERDDVFEWGYSTSEAGNGFGLKIVRQIVEAHDWDVRIVEGTDGGTRFEITGVEFAER